MVWMRPSPASTFRKYYGKIHDGLPSGTYTLRINNSKISYLYIIYIILNVCRL